MEVFNVNAIGPLTTVQQLVKAGLVGPPGSIVGTLTSKASRLPCWGPASRVRQPPGIPWRLGFLPLPAQGRQGASTGIFAHLLYIQGMQQGQAPCWPCAHRGQPRDLQRLCQILPASGHDQHYCKRFQTCTNRGKTYLALVGPGLCASSRTRDFARDWCLSKSYCSTEVVCTDLLQSGHHFLDATASG